MSSDFTKRIIDPSLLKAHPRRVPLRVFLCGPGEKHPFYHARVKIRDYLSSQPNIRVTLGEDLIDKKGLYKGDLQTVEGLEAERSDFTILLVDSPGAIAELGSFSTSDFLRNRIFTVIPTEFYQSESYIARGPLSVLAQRFQSSVIYFDRKNFEDLKRAVMVPVAMFKYIASKYSRYYRPYLNKKRFDHDPAAYFQAFLSDRSDFMQAFTLAAILVSDQPTFADLLSFMAISPRELTRSLRPLYEKESIEKRGGKYFALKGYNDPVISRLSSTAISQRRASVVL